MKLRVTVSDRSMEGTMNDLRSNLYDHGSTSNGQQRSPEIVHRVCCIYMANLTKAERHSSDGDCDGEKSGSHCPAKTLRAIEEFFSRSDIPADLEVHRQRADEDPYSSGKCSSDQKGAREGAYQTGIHVVWGDLIMALRWSSPERDHESNRHESCRDDETVYGGVPSVNEVRSGYEGSLTAKIMLSGLLRRQNQECKQQKQQTYQARDVEGLSHTIPDLEVGRINEVC